LFAVGEGIGGRADDKKCTDGGPEQQCHAGESREKNLEIVLYGWRNEQGWTKKIVENAQVLGDNWAEVDALAL